MSPFSAIAEGPERLAQPGDSGKHLRLHQKVRFRVEAFGTGRQPASNAQLERQQDEVLIAMVVNMARMWTAMITIMTMVMVMFRV